MGRLPPPPSGWEWNGSQSRQGAIELGFPGRALGQMQSEAARRAGEPRIASLRIVTDRWGCNHVGGASGEWQNREFLWRTHIYLQIANGYVANGYVA